jgi:hypothetical protein
MTADEFDALLRRRLAPIEAKLDGLPLIHKAIETARHDVGQLRAAFNDFAKTNVTSGEIEALNEDMNRLQAEHAELAVRIATAERLIRESRDN